MSTKTFEPESLLEALLRHEVRFILIGGLASGMQGVVWPTFDVDTVIDPAEDNLEHLLAALLEIGAVYNTPHQPPIRPELYRLRQYTGPQLFRTRLGRLDVLKDSGEDTFESLSADAATFHIEGRPVRVASLPALVRMKQAANRAKDRKVLPRLLEALQAREDARRG